MLRRVGAKNYKNDVLIAIPNGELGWDAVELVYQELMRKESKHDMDDLKRHWIRNLCKGMKKPAGQPGAANNWLWLMSGNVSTKAKTLMTSLPK